MADISSPESTTTEAPKGLTVLNVSELERQIRRGIVRDGNGVRKPTVRLYGREIKSVDRQGRTGRVLYQVKLLSPTEDPDSNAFVDCSVNKYFPHVVRLDVVDENGDFVDQAIELTDENITSFRFRVIPPVMRASE